MFCCVAAHPGHAALAPREVDKKVVITGKAAAEIAELFGLDKGSRHSVPLPLWKYEIWLTDIAKEFPENQPQPTQYNIMEYQHFNQHSSVTIYSKWLDLGSRLPKPEPNHFSFTSAFVLERLDDRCDIWTRLVQRLQKDSAWNWNADHINTPPNPTGNPVFERCFDSDNGSRLCVEVKNADSYAEKDKRIGYYVIVTVEVKSEAKASN